MVLRGGRDVWAGARGQEGNDTPAGRPVLLAKQGGENAQSGLPEHTWHKEGDSGKESR